jgi:CheY-like chemotaxis protein
LYLFGRTIGLSRIGEGRDFPVREKRRVLVVDDEGVLLRAFKRILVRFDVTTSSSIAEARRCVAAARFDVVVCDVHLRDGNGIDLFDELRKDAPEQGARFVFASGLADDPKVRARLEATGAPYVCKPFVVPTFLEIVTCLSEGRQPRRTSSARRLWIARPYV